MIIGEFVDTYPPTLDGVGRVTLSYCQHLNDMGHTAYYIAPDSPAWQEAAKVPTLLQTSLPIPGEHYRLGLPFIDLRYRREVDRVPFDIVHTHSPFSAGEEALRVARKLDIPLVSTFHSKYLKDFYDKTHSMLIAKTVVQHIIRFYNKCDAVWTVNNATADVLREYGYQGDIGIFENGTDLEGIEPAALARMKAKLLPDKRPMLLFVGQHNYKKNLHGVLGACALLKEKQVDFRLVTAGTGPDFDAIVEEARTLGIADKCQFLGFMSDRSELMSVYSMADLLVFPSVYDNAPMVLREAAAMGTPGIVVAGSCSAEGVQDGYNGFICRDESAEAIAECILRALPHTKTVGSNAKATIPMAWKDIIAQVLVEYDRLIQQKRG